jgi:putative endonuclease
MGLVQFIAGLSNRFSKRSSHRTEEENPAHALGRLGEKLAAKHLQRSGYKVLYRNFRHRHGGEVDLVCRDRRSDELVFVEVKARRTRDFGAPAHAVDAEKRDLIARGAIAWLRLLDWPDIRYRFDIVEVIVPLQSQAELNIIENAFPLPARYRV